MPPIVRLVPGRLMPSDAVSSVPPKSAMEERAVFSRIERSLAFIPRLFSAPREGS